jgi:hypothetical protein
VTRPGGPRKVRSRRVELRCWPRGSSLESPAVGKGKKSRLGVTLPPSGRKPEYAMPCPQCKTLIDARLKHCPHCGVDTDKKLLPARIVFMFVTIALILGLVALARRCTGG